MKNGIALCLLISLLGCTSAFDEYQDKYINLSVLQKATRIIPAKEKYLLVEIKVNPHNEESGRQLLLYDKQGNFVDGISVFGMVQKVGAEEIAINHPIDQSDWNAPGNIGFLSIDYIDITRVSKGGGNNGSHLVDSLKYNSGNKSVIVYSKKPVRQFVIQPKELIFNEALFTQSEIFRIPLQDIDFNPFYDNRFTVTSWESRSQTNATIDFYFDNRRILDDFFQQVVTAEVAK